MFVLLLLFQFFYKNEVILAYYQNQIILYEYPWEIIRSRLKLFNIYSVIN